MASQDRLIARWCNFQQPILNELECRICKHTNIITNYKKYYSNDMFHAGQLVRYQCPNCDVIFGDLRFLGLPASEIDDDYSDLYSYHKEGNSGPIFYECMKQIPYFLDKTKSILDFAAGVWSSLIPSFRDDGYNIIGYDKYVENCNYIVPSIEGCKFDIVYTSNYIEHVIDPVKNFKELMTHVEDDGVLIMIGPCFDYHMPNTHYHTFFFVNDKSLNYICNDVGIYIKDSYRISVASYPENPITIKVFARRVSGV